MKLREKEPYLANAVLRTLRIWKKRCGPRPMIVTEEDIDQLADWADHLHKIYKWTEDFHAEHGMSTNKIPTQIKRRGYEL